MLPPGARVLAMSLVALALVSACAGDDDETRPAATTPTTAPDSAPARERPEGPTPRVTALAGAVGMPSPVDLAAQDYVEEEFLLAGEATAYGKQGEWTTDGKWSATPTRTAAYTTRAIVRRPSDPAKFNGTVVVEWFNVSGSLDASPDFGYLYAELLRRGYIWVGVSAQELGVRATATGNPRYAELNHPGDAFAYDMYTQTGRAARAGALFDKAYDIQAVIAAGESQSAILLTTYVNAIDPLVKMYDGFLVHSRFSMSGPLGDSSILPNPAEIRDDTEVPVLVVLSETDVGFNLETRQPDGERYRLWEIAGTAHADQYLLDLFVRPEPGAPPANPLGCTSPVNSANQHWVLKAALAHLNTWVRGGSPPPESPRLTMSEDDPREIARDEYGNALGGIRLPELEVPVATLTGKASPGSPGFCVLFGATVAFDAARLAVLYPDHDTYVSAYNDAVDRLYDAGFILEPEAAEAKAAAEASTIGT